MAENKEMNRIAILIPCKNEGNAIAKLVESYKKNLPNADIYVYNNLSTDNTEEEAIKAGAIVKNITRPGKGNVVRAMFREIDADIYLLTDGDGTYQVIDAIQLIQTLEKENADMIVGSRIGSYIQSESRVGHYLGNKLLSKLVSTLFNEEIHDLLSGFRAFSKRFVKSAPLFSKGFELETNLSIHAIEIDAKTVEIPIMYNKREEGTKSKLNTFSDGLKILQTIIKLFIYYRPFQLCLVLSCLLSFIGLLLGIPVILDYIETGLVPKFPRAILASALMIIATLIGALGVIMQSIAQTRRELKKIAFLSYLR
jgi:glycosyltransferase involved in cell wall biosynthesis